MIFRSRAPFRLGLAGGGTDVSPYSDLYGGAILNATVSLYASATIELIDDPLVELHSIDQKQVQIFQMDEELQLHTGLELQKGVILRMRQERWLPEGKGFRLTTAMDVPAGSGLGTSSTLVVAILKAFAEWNNLPLGDYDMAHLAYEIETKELGLAGGKQDQYAATFGGFNFMEFYHDDQVIVNPLRIKPEYIQELEHNLILYFTSSSRKSTEIIQEQQLNVENKKQSSIEAMHQLKEQARLMKEALLRGRLHEIGEILDYGFEQKRKMAHSISNESLDHIYSSAKEAGATGGKISGAGGGGFMFFYCPGNTKYAVAEQLKKQSGYIISSHFTDRGVQSWRASSKL